ncbi:MAG: prolipoprotein diacylglyceryl transferase [Verrucomicrobiales bacterium]|nr:prolipoprotein diacylglyceryl transferase [Verrucomicrobiales bacterium]
MHGTSYAGWMLAALALSGWLWFRAGRRDPHLPLIFIGGLLGAFLGAKLVYLLAEGWNDLGRPDLALRWATGKTILGGLLFGYAGVELTKKALRYTRPTGDRFAIMVPLALILGRIGCLTHGCCLGRPCPPAWYARTDSAGVPRWPAVPAEIAFHALALAAALVLQATGRLPGQRFHVYLIAYGVFRFVTEFQRDTLRLLGPFTGYHVAALALVALGAVRFGQRQHQRQTPTSPVSASA